MAAPLGKWLGSKSALAKLPVMKEKCVRSFPLDLDQHLSLYGRFPADHFVLDAGHYRVDQDKRGMGYTPFSPSPYGDSPHWYHEVHVGIVPMAGPNPEAEPPEQMRHLVLRNPEAPGPHKTAASASEAFRAIPDADRSFTLEERSSVVFWVQAGEYNDWEKGKHAFGTMWIKLMEVSP